MTPCKEATVATDLGIDGNRLGEIGSRWNDGGLWDDALWLAARAWEDTDQDEHRHRWHHLVMAVGNFKRQQGRRPPFCQHGLRQPQSLPSLKGETDQVDSDDHANHADAART